MTTTRIDRWLVHTCTIQRVSEGVLDPFGAPEETWADLRTDEPCRLYNISPRSRPREITDPVKQNAVVADYNMFIDSDVEITELDRIKDITADTKSLIVGPLDIVLINDHFGREGTREYTMLYLKRRGQM